MFMNRAKQVCLPVALPAKWRFPAPSNERALAARVTFLRKASRTAVP